MRLTSSFLKTTQEKESDICSGGSNYNMSHVILFYYFFQVYAYNTLLFILFCIFIFVTSLLFQCKSASPIFLLLFAFAFRQVSENFE